MAKARRSVKWSAMLVAVMVILSFSLASVVAASPKTKTFVIRESGTYVAIGSVTITASGKSVDTSKTGTIKFNDGTNVVWSTTCQFIPAGTVYNYSISSIKEGGTITLTTNSSYQFAPKKLTGKIHVNGSHVLWKIDSFGCGFYFRET